MAKNYKEMLTGTLSSIVGKVKEVAESGAVRDTIDRGANKAKSYARIAKLSLELAGENDELKKVYTEIGKLYYEQAKDAPEGFFAPLFTQAEEICTRIEEKEAEIEALKADEEDEIEVEFEEVVAASEEECACTCECEATAEEAPACECECEAPAEEAPACECECEAPAEEKTEE